MNNIDQDIRRTLERCEIGPLSDIRNAIRSDARIDLDLIARCFREELARSSVSLSILRGMARAVASLLPDSWSLMRELLFTTKPKAVYEVHFSLFGSLDPDNFNQLERDGIELLLVEYLFQVRSTAEFAAWKAGLVLGEEWRSERSEMELRWLMTSARFPAGRMGGINGYRFIVQRRETFVEDELRPLRSLVRTDKSQTVREGAKFHLDRLIKLRNAASSIKGEVE